MEAIAYIIQQTRLVYAYHICRAQYNGLLPMMAKPMKTLEKAIFTFVCLVTWPLDASEVESDLALIQTSRLFHSNANY